MTQKLKLVVFVVVFQFHWHFLRWVAGQNTQTQNTQAQNTQGQNTQSPKIPLQDAFNYLIGIVVSILGILALSILALGILGWNPLGDRKFKLKILGLSIFIIFCSWPSRFLTFTS